MFRGVFFLMLALFAPTSPAAALTAARRPWSRMPLQAIRKNADEYALRESWNAFQAQSDKARTPSSSIMIYASTYEADALRCAAMPIGWIG